MVDVGQHLVQVTYALEGDGPLELLAYEKLQAVTPAFAVKEWPKLRKVAARLADEDPELTVAALEARAMQGAQPAIKWFLHKFNLGLGDTVAAFRKARLSDPVVVQSMNITGNHVRQLSCFPFFTDTILDGLAKELPKYLAAVTDIHL